MSNNNIKAIKTYVNLNINKLIIYKENYKKCGIYRWNNIITGKSYVGSSTNLNKRFSDYFSIDKFRRIRTKGRSLIYSAILKYKLSNFSLDILEYCNHNIIIEREQYYLNIVKPKYNILKMAGSRLGHKLSEETKIKMSINKKGNKNPMYGKTHTKETRKKISEANKLYKKYNKMTLANKLRLSLVSIGLIIKVYNNSKNLINEFSSLKETARYFNVSLSFIRKYLDSNLDYKGFTFVSKIKNNQIKVYDQNNKLIETLSSPMEISKLYNIPKSTLYSYIKSGKLYKNKFHFRKT